MTLPFLYFVGAIVSLCFYTKWTCDELSYRVVFEDLELSVGHWIAYAVILVVFSLLWPIMWPIRFVASIVNAVAAARSF